MSAFRLLGFDPLQRQSIGPNNKNQFKATQKEKAQSVNQIVDPGSTRKEAEDFRAVENHFNEDIFEFGLESLEMNLDDSGDFSTSIVYKH